MLTRFGPWVLVLGSAVALGGLILATFPTPPARMIFLGLLFTTVFGMALLLLRRFYSQRLPAAVRARDPRRAVREGLMVAGFVMLCAWLRMIRVLSVANALLLLGVLVFMEAFLVSRTE